MSEENVNVSLLQENGERLSNQLYSLPITTNAKDLRQLYRHLRLEVEGDDETERIDEESKLCSFLIENNEISDSIESAYYQLGKKRKSLQEIQLNIICVPKSLLRVRPITRCSSTLNGHSSAIISCSFSPNSKLLATGSGDTTLRLWDMNTQLIDNVFRGHKEWLLVVEWASNGKYIGSACKEGTICVWNLKENRLQSKKIMAHKKWINSLSWKPLHLMRSEEDYQLVSGSKDGGLIIWNAVDMTCGRRLNGHKQSVTTVKWGGSNLIYSSSQDCSIKIWRSTDGTLCRSLSNHSHWVNSISLNTDYLLRTSFYDTIKEKEETIIKLEKGSLNEQILYSRKRYDCAISKLKGSHSIDGELLISASDDFTLCLWNGEHSNKCIERLTGHQQAINDVKFSPNMRLIASASFDKSIRIWDGFTGKFYMTLRGHIRPVYQVAWSVDSRTIVSGSADSTLKIWRCGDKMNDGDKKRLMMDLPGHADQVYAVDWSTDGSSIGSGGKDHMVKLWRN
ncbi:hypothetical protein SNEBB_007623 [Seison nebaliae]|nr:hypothetical protein SNEBB_007623 [Seison nebaliae]